MQSQKKGDNKAQPFIALNENEKKAIELFRQLTKSQKDLIQRKATAATNR